MSNRPTLPPDDPKVAMTSMWTTISQLLDNDTRMERWVNELRTDVRERLGAMEERVKERLDANEANMNQRLDRTDAHLEQQDKDYAIKHDELKNALSMLNTRMAVKERPWPQGAIQAVYVTGGVIMAMVGIVGGFISHWRF